MAKRFVYFFGGNKADGNGKMKELLGGKGANLAEMVILGIPVPAGFTISTEACNFYYQNNRKYPPGLDKEIAKVSGEKDKSEAKLAKFGGNVPPAVVEQERVRLTEWTAKLDALRTQRERL